MIASYDGKIYNDSEPYVNYSVNDILNGQRYTIYIDVDGDVYAEVSTEPLNQYDIVDQLTGVVYGLFVYDGQVHSAPMKTPDGDIIYGNSCFISAGSTLNIKVKRNSDVLITSNDINVEIYNRDSREYG